MMNTNAEEQSREASRDVVKNTPVKPFMRSHQPLSPNPFVHDVPNDECIYACLTDNLKLQLVLQYPARKDPPLTNLCDFAGTSLHPLLPKHPV